MVKFRSILGIAKVAGKITMNRKFSILRSNTSHKIWRFLIKPPGMRVTNKYYSTY